jgi:SNF2 family DNA or RNA helicase
MIVHPKAHKYQAKALKFSLDNRASYQSLDLGLGKTLIAIMWANNIEHRGVLIVSPIKVMYNTWPSELKKWAPDMTYSVVHGPNKLKALHAKADVYLTNFESIVWLFAAIKKMKRVPFNALIIDEGSKIKAHNTKRFKALRAMRDIFTEGKIILSGTPAPNSLLNLWSQYFMLDSGVRLGKAYGEYQARYFDPLDRDGRMWAIKPGVSQVIYDRIKDITFRLDGADYIEMPERVDNFIKLTLPPSAREKYDTLEKDFFLELGEGKNIELFNSMALSMKLRQLVQGAIYTDKERNYEVIHNEKIEALQEVVEEAQGTPVLCAIQFIFELDLIRSVYPNAPVIRGGVSNTEATRLVQLWNERKIPLLLCHPNSLSHGMNMQYGSNIIVWLGLPWSGEVYEQFIGRLKRQGQSEKTVVVNHIICRNTIDVAIANALRNKAKGQQALLDYINKYHNGEMEDI